MTKYKEYDAFLLDIYQELTLKDTPYRFGYRYELAGELLPTLKLSVTFKHFRGGAVSAEINQHETREVIIAKYRELAAELERTNKVPNEKEAIASK